MSDEQQATEPQLTMSRDEIFTLHPLPWTHHLLLIKDAEGRQVVHTGGLYSERGRPHEGKYLSGLNALLVEAVNADLATVAQPPIAEIDVSPRICAKCGHAESYRNVTRRYECYEGGLPPCGCYCEFPSLQPPSPQSEEIAREIVDRVFGKQGSSPIYQTAGRLIEELTNYIASALTSAQQRGAELQREGYQRRLFDECRIANWDPDLKNTLPEEIAHLHEELSEAFRAWRRYKDCQVREVNGKLEGVPIEFADVLIGMFYNAELHGFDLFAAVEQKHQYNLTRNYVEEGRQLHAPAKQQ